MAQRRGFRVVCGLWVYPDFSEVETGRRAAPWINHDRIDFDALAKLLTATFCYGPPTILSVTNDTIDQVTILARAGAVPAPIRGSGDPACADFGQAALAAAPKRLVPNEIIDVRSAFHPLHSIQNRSYAPPPMLIPFIGQSSDFEDAMIWFSQCAMAIGVDMVAQEFADSAAAEDDQVGVLPAELKTGLEKIFGCPFESQSVINHLAMDPLPRAQMLPR
jgi:hypothetical protein